MNALRQWFSLVILTTAFCGLVYMAVQQNYRQSANDPQIQIAEDVAVRLARGEDPHAAVATFEESSQLVDIGNSLAPFVIIYDDAGNPIASSAMLDGVTPVPPTGVLEAARREKENRVTWEPKSDVREATVVTRYTGSTSGFVLAGRSLREVEKRTRMLTLEVGLVWIATLVLTLAIILFMSLLSFLFRAKKNTPQ